jgi:tetratricopeptide (TPR) repeat protein
MTPERWERVNRIFDVAIDLPPGPREEYIRRECRNDEEYDTVSRMIEEHFHETGPLDERPTWPYSHALGVFAEGQTVAGRYRIIRFIGRGGMGEVYEVEDLELQERAALKTLLPEIAADERMIARFKQEIQLSRKIGHPNVCRMFDLGRHAGDGLSQGPVVFLTEELLEGENLSERLQREGRLAADAALPLLEQMAAGLDAVHRTGILHRDLKPSNVMLAGRAVLTDFGLARTFTPSAETAASQTGQVMGTVDYMAPEQLTGQAATVSSDIYALGMVAYKMVTGALPFDAETPFAAAILRSKAPLPPPRSKVPDLDPVFERAILRALDVEPKRRFASAADFVKALRGEAVSMTVSLPVMTRRRWVGAVAAVVVVVAGGVGWRSWSHYRERPPAEALAFYQQGVDDIHAGAYFAATKALEKATQIAPHFGPAHARLAEAWNELDVSEKARQEMLLARRESNVGLAAIDRLEIEAIDLTITREFAAAAAKYQQMRPLVQAQDAGFEIDLGRAYEKAAQPAKAIECYRHAAEAASPNPSAWLHLAVLHSRASNFPQARRGFREAEDLYQVTNNLAGLTEVAYEQGIDANRQRQLDEAAKYLSKALETARLAGNVQQEIRAMLQLANNAYLAGDTEKAERTAREALETAQVNQMEVLAISSIVNLGNACLRKRDFSGAEKYYQDALTLARRNGSPRGAALSLISLAALHDQVKRPTTPLAKLVKLYRITRRMDSRKNHSSASCY